MHRVEI